MQNWRFRSGGSCISGDTFQFKASKNATFTKISDAVNLADNFFFNSSNGIKVTSGNPASTNLLGTTLKC
jgi:hypothetical protein